LSHQGLTGQSIAVIERRRDTAEQILRKLNVAHQRSPAMSENKEKSAVLIRLEAAISLHETEHPGKPISISQLCKQAGVNRANLYASHPQLLDRIRGIALQRSKK
jgi:hypothetical protein